MSYWALTVITNLLTCLPIFGVDVLFYGWGGYFILSMTVSRCFCFHFLLPFGVCGVVVLHVVLLHAYGSGCGGGVLGSSTDGEQFLLFF